MKLEEALFLAKDIVEEAASNTSDKRLYEVVQLLQYALDENFCNCAEYVTERLIKISEDDWDIRASLDIQAILDGRIEE